jgi:hypothetical protein
LLCEYGLFLGIMRALSLNFAFELYNADFCVLNYFTF